MTANSIHEDVRTLRQTFAAGVTRPLRWRLQQLSALRAFFLDHENNIIEALQHDLGRPKFETLTADVLHIVGEIKLLQRRLPSWCKPERVGTPFFLKPARAFIMREPLGVALIIGPWNYPVQLVLNPLAGAIAAGNCAIIKPSEISVATSELLTRELPRYLDNSAIRVVQGGITEATALLEERFDHIFYTGNGSVGRIVMTAAAKHLTPVTLELGGKSPCIVDASARLDVAARRIAWGKWFNAGQTCVAPDYVLVHKEVHDALLQQLKMTLRDFYGDDPKQSPYYGRIINEHHVDRLSRLFDSGTIVAGGEIDKANKYIAPSLFDQVAADSAIMSEEIFGPLLPIISVDDVDTAIEFVNARPKPLALYFFTENKSNAERVLARTSSGGAAINHTWYHLAVPNLPFGGVGESGMGAYHARASFECFSHRRSVLDKPIAPDVDVLSPPHKSWALRLMAKLY